MSSTIKRFSSPVLFVYSMPFLLHLHSSYKTDRSQQTDQPSLYWHLQFPSLCIVSLVMLLVTTYVLYCTVSLLLYSTCTYTSTVCNRLTDRQKYCISVCLCCTVVTVVMCHTHTTYRTARYVACMTGFIPVALWTMTLWLWWLVICEQVVIDW